VDFRRFAEEKTRAAEQAVIQPLHTVEDRSDAFRLRPIGNAWTRRHYDGDFHLFDPPPSLPAMSMVFVQSRDGNTVTANPATLGGGPTDTYLLYEGLSRVAADAVLAGAASVGKSVFFSIWHPELVSLRLDLGLSRHPAQAVISREGRVNLDAMLFNVPEVPVFIILGDTGRRRCERVIRDRPWITIVPLAEDLPGAFHRLRVEHGLSRVSVIGGRSTASSLVDAGLIHDLCLTTTSQSGGTPGTPYHSGPRPPELQPIVRKQGGGDAFPIRFEHSAVTHA
jgi:riboflavin biosynthesis pyrimidine reductase